MLSDFISLGDILPFFRVDYECRAYNRMVIKHIVLPLMNEIVESLRQENILHYYPVDSECRAYNRMMIKPIVLPFINETVGSFSSKTAENNTPFYT
ncbi:hypothetical protein CDAR_373651 [Caerostris darwini]|uniref:Uncharacterized protein n=1 Tax=Caerostris darwini TaxID=1538125 RepID=A0AAV4QHN8_9ARAC|nr:hypothetical protein CDAR_373651 [Caerostris darwini]